MPYDPNNDETGIDPFLLLRGQVPAARKHPAAKPPPASTPSQFGPKDSTDALGRPVKNGGNGNSGGGDAGQHDKNKASNRYIEQAQTLALQAKALRAALGKKGFKAALKTKLENVRLVQGQQDDELVRGYSDRVGSLDQAASDNEQAGAGQSTANAMNAARERANALSEIASQGAGESDALRATQMSLRNWQQNQQDVNRAYFDTLTSVNSSLTDLTTDTRTARMNNAIQADADKQQLWNSYYDQRSETLTQLGNTLGQMAEYYGMANELHGRKKTRRRRNAVSDASGEAFMDAAHVAGMAHESRGVPGRLSRWGGADPYRASALVSSVDIGEPVVAPEGATLRKWTA